MVEHGCVEVSEGVEMELFHVHLNWIFSEAQVQLSFKFSDFFSFVSQTN